MAKRFYYSLKQTVARGEKSESDLDVGKTDVFL